MGRLSSAILWAALAVLLLGGLYKGFKFSLGEREPGEPHSLTYRLVISAPQPVAEPPVFKVTQGDRISFVFRSDRPGEAHVHGYEKMVVLKPGSDVSLTFMATNAGLFAIHLHDPDGSMHALGTLEVQPR
jgi:hypothetical protein